MTWHSFISCSVLLDLGLNNFLEACLLTFCTWNSVVVAKFNYCFRCSLVTTQKNLTIKLFLERKADTLICRDIIQYARSSRTFRKNALLLFSGWKNDVYGRLPVTLYWIWKTYFSFHHAKPLEWFPFRSYFFALTKWTLHIRRTLT
jgi:hypothetical protein